MAKAVKKKSYTEANIRDAYSEGYWRAKGAGSALTLPALLKKLNKVKHNG